MERNHWSQRRKQMQRGGIIMKDRQLKAGSKARRLGMPNPKHGHGCWSCVSAQQRP